MNESKVHYFKLVRNMLKILSDWCRLPIFMPLVVDMALLMTSSV